jgi:hypothetical protein
MLRQSIVLRRFSSYLAIATCALLAAWHQGSSPFNVTFRFGTEVIGPEPALDLVLPSTGERGVTQAGAPGRPAPNAPQRVAEIWVTLAPSVAAKRLGALARSSADGRPVRGTCEIDVTARVSAKPRRYTVAGCYVKAVDASGDAQRATLGYASITVSE